MKIAKSGDAARRAEELADGDVVDQQQCEGLDQATRGSRAGDVLVARLELAPHQQAQQLAAAQDVADRDDRPAANPARGPRTALAPTEREGASLCLCRHSAPFRRGRGARRPRSTSWLSRERDDRSYLTEICPRPTLSRAGARCGRLRPCPCACPQQRGGDRQHDVGWRLSWCARSRPVRRRGSSRRRRAPWPRHRDLRLATAGVTVAGWVSTARTATRSTAVGLRRSWPLLRRTRAAARATPHVRRAHPGYRRRHDRRRRGPRRSNGPRRVPGAVLVHQRLVQADAR